MKKKLIKITPGIYMWDKEHFMKCSRCGRLMGTIGIPECAAGYVACDMQLSTEFKDFRQFAWMAIQDKMWRYASWYKKREFSEDSWDEMHKYTDQVKSIMDDLVKMSKKRKIEIST